MFAEVIVRNAIALAHRYHLSGGFIGLTILSIGTSIPEIVTHVVASVNILHQPGSMVTLSALVLGANVGSDIFQQDFVLPFVGLIGLCFVLVAVVTDRVVEAARLLVDLLPLSASLFAVLFLGMASALPEFSTALLSILRGEREISAGILIGSNVTNPLLGVGAELWFPDTPSPTSLSSMTCRSRSRRAV